MRQEEFTQMLKKLSQRQIQVFFLVSEGKMNKTIAHELGISEKTVKNTRYRICKVLQLNGHNALYKLAIQLRENIKDFRTEF